MNIPNKWGLRWCSFLMAGMKNNSRLTKCSVNCVGFYFTMLYTLTILSHCVSHSFIFFYLCNYDKNFFGELFLPYTANVHWDILQHFLYACGYPSCSLLPERILTKSRSLNTSLGFITALDEPLFAGFSV